VLPVRQEQSRPPPRDRLVFAIDFALFNLVEEYKLEWPIGTKEGRHLCESVGKRVVRRFREIQTQLDSKAVSAGRSAGIIRLLSVGSQPSDTVKAHFY